MLSNEQNIMSSQVIDKLNDSGVVAVLVIDKISHAIPLAKALLQGGVSVIELTLRTPVALEAAKIIIKEVPGVSVGLGTVLTVDQVKAASETGVDFAVAPGCNPKVIATALEFGLSFAPGIATPTDIEMALELGCRILKYFPAETLGGMKHLSSMAAPYQHLGLSFIPLGGINFSNAGSYLESPLICAIGGSWIANRKSIQEEDWDTITKNAREIRELINHIRG